MHEICVKYPLRSCYPCILEAEAEDTRLWEASVVELEAWFKRNEFCEDVWKYYRSTTGKDKLTQLDRALEHVRADKEKDRQDENWHNDDFTEVLWNGKKYKFNKPQQALSVEYLWKNKRAREKSIGEAIGSEADNFRLIHTFRQHGKKTKMHPAWETMIVPDGKGIFALAECKKAPKK